MVRILKNEEEFKNKGIYCPKGVMIHGPPGTGKTLFAKAIAGEAGVPFFAASDTDFVEFSPGNQSLLSVDEDQAESELLLHFLISLKDQMQKQASKLVEEVGCLQADLEDVGKRHMLITQASSSKEPLRLEAFPRASSLSNMIEARLIRNIDQLENAYFTMKSQGQLSDSSEMGRTDKDLLQNRERCTFEVSGTLRNADLLNSANVFCSLSFDWDEDFFAAGGVSMKIKIFDFRYLLDDSVDIHYPIIKLSSKSKLSCICWNNYIKNFLASTDYDGVVQSSPHYTNLLAFGSADYMTYCYDLCNTKNPWCTLSGHGKAVSYVKFLDPETLIFASTDNTLMLWDLNKMNSSGLSVNACSLTFRGHTNENVSLSL
ncbi:hypothetical protein GIB67_042798 [Kingdonia uniflora]|uniref:AAA+ ATPase domain-containing protein n=1 Tax=Kingdonia uniflora TaxID=39325 RepID=A0A7J7L131_9MAGN|nr:hypothetical protein GIB67_042798 [Kingdonia uniflora]